MAGGGELGGGQKQRRGKQGKRKAKKRLGFRLDMTPLVDITFLLLTFFMLTTSMITPQTMEMNVPPELDVPIEVKQSELLTIRVREDGKMFYNMGMDAPEKITIKGLKKVVVDQNVTLKNRCIVVLKGSGEAPYGQVVQILDELNAAEPDIIEGLKRIGINERKRKFTVSPYEAKDAEELKGL
ncbi:MAG: biopolymer transporter ExbD [Ignavibacteria bacterium]|nr:biopolymer transporter ExbD [Ignavibacteria bacterium]MBP6509336.1 biopolymer transporter ExbD [Candidatus Kapabacteria bacterium]MBK6418392.1 biopolymer transporter ExbD [Ignavibacteria bacterium]MBK6761069.1 biopolymer transporter ExbD [Ignavibacteria bacterium]MBK7186753.1 biopolymer transporter ExbD [Ignavibacteria bacterium]